MNLIFLIQSSEISQLEKTLQKKFTPDEGPHIRSLEESLKELNVQRQAYHGGTFVGNHVHKLLKVMLIKQMSIFNELPFTCTCID